MLCPVKHHFTLVTYHHIILRHLIRRSTLDYDLVSHRIFSRNRVLFSGEDVMILYIHILIHLKA